MNPNAPTGNELSALVCMAQVGVAAIAAAELWEKADALGMAYETGSLESGTDVDAAFAEADAAEDRVLDLIAGLTNDEIALATAVAWAKPGLFGDRDL